MKPENQPRIFLEKGGHYELWEEKRETEGKKDYFHRLAGTPEIFSYFL